MTTPDTSNSDESKKNIEGFISFNIADESKTDERKLNENEIEEPQSDVHESDKAQSENSSVHDAPEEKASAKNYDYSSLADITLSVLNDNGLSIDDVGLENRVISLIDELRDKEITDLEQPAVALSNLRSLHKFYDEKTVRSENINSGISTRHGILKGMIKNAEKNLLRIKGKKWVAHHKEIYGEKSLRSSQQYMALAKVPNILQHAAIGKERLTKVLRAIKTLGITGDDPIAALFQRYGIQFDPNSQFEESMTDLQLGVDYILAIAKIKKYEETMEFDLGVDLDLIKRMINEGYSISSQFIKNLFEIKNVNHDVNAHIEIICNGSGNGDDMLPHIKNAEAIPKILEGLKDTVESIRAHRTLAGRIKQDHVDELENYVTELKGLIENTDSASE